MATSRITNYDEVGQGPKPALKSTKVLANKPARPGGSQPATVGSGGTDHAVRGDLGDKVAPRITPVNPHGPQGTVQP